MAVTADTFKARFAEFAPTADALVSAVIAEAGAELDVNVLGARSIDHAVMLLTAHKLTISPQGTPARLEGTAADADPLTRTTYGTELLDLMRKRAGGPWLIGRW